MMSRPVDINSAAVRVVAGMQPEFEFLVHYAAAELAPLVESEIELMLLTSFRLCGSLTRMKFAIAGADPLDSFDIAIFPQYEWGKYRIDFCLKVRNFDPLFFIECDGHDFHERTKEQAEHDRSKDRAIQAAGISILRFTGREIWRDPGRVVAEIINFLSPAKVANGQD